jgi:hypothetical protein
VVGLGHIRDRHRVVMDVHSDVERASVCQG